METKPTKTLVHRVAGALKHSKRKQVSLDSLSRLVGLYPDVLGETLAYFEPMIRMDPSINCRDLLPALEAYLAEPSERKTVSRAPRIAKKEIEQYSSIADFVYKRMTTAGGLVDSSLRLSDADLEILKRLVEKETSRRRKEAKKK